MAARPTGQCIVGRMTKHCHLPTVILTDEGSQFRSEVVKPTAQTLEIRISHRLSKHAQTSEELMPLKQASSDHKCRNTYNYW